MLTTQVHGDPEGPSGDTELRCTPLSMVWATLRHGHSPPCPFVTFLLISSGRSIALCLVLFPITAGKGQGQRWNEGVRANTFCWFTRRRWGMNECASPTFMEHLRRARCVRSAPYISPPLVPTILPAGSCDKPHFTDEEVEAQRNDFAQEHKTGRLQS